MPNLPEAVAQALTELKARLTGMYGNRLVRVVLYGSFARGDFSEGSDVDVAVFLRGEVAIGKEIDRIGPVASEIGLHYGLALSVLPLPETWWQTRTSPLLLNLRREGMTL